ESLGEGRAVAYVDVAGLGPLYGPEPRLAARLAAAAAAAFESLLDLSPQSSSCAARAGIAATKFTAWVAAALAGQFAVGEQAMVVPPGEEATFLAPLPL